MRSRSPSSRNFQGGLEVAGAAPAGVFLIFEHLARVEGGDVAARGGGGEVVEAPERGTPVKMLERAVRVGPEGIGAVFRGEKPDAAARVEANGVAC